VYSVTACVGDIAEQFEGTGAEADLRPGGAVVTAGASARLPPRSPSSASERLSTRPRAGLSGHCRQSGDVDAQADFARHDRRSGTETCRKHHRSVLLSRFLDHIRSLPYNRLHTRKPLSYMGYPGGIKDLVGLVG